MDGGVRVTGPCNVHAGMVPCFIDVLVGDRAANGTTHPPFAFPTQTILFGPLPSLIIALIVPRHVVVNGCPCRRLISLLQPPPLGPSTAPPCCRARRMKWLGRGPNIAIVNYESAYDLISMVLATTRPKVTFHK